MWVARDKNGTLTLWVNEYPKREYGIWIALNKFGYEDWGVNIDKNLFPNLTWEDEPIEIELTKVDRHFIQCDKCGKAFSYLDRDVNYFTACIQPSSVYEEDLEFVNCPHCKSEVYL